MLSIVNLGIARPITQSMNSNREELLVQLYDVWGKPAQAAEWTKKLAEVQQAANADAKKVPKP